MMRILRSLRLRPGNDDERQSGFAMFIALLLIVVVAGMALLVAGLVISESKPTQTQRKTVATLNASEAGFEVALHRLRIATDNYGNGILTKLPCTATSSAVGTPLNGSVGPKTGAASNQTLTFAVFVRYYDDDPSTMGTTDLNQNAIACSGGAPVSVPQYAYLQSNGVGVGGANATSTAGDRALHTTYHFKTSTLNIAGGRLNMNTTSLCLDAGSTDPIVGAAVTLSQCQNRGVTPSQSSWSYRADLTIYLTTTGSPGMCLTAGSTFGTTSTSKLTLQTCATDGTATTYPYQASPSLQQSQEWSFDDNGKFEGAAAGGNINGNCITANPYNNPVVGGFLYEQACDSGGFDTETWNPDPQVGAGAAGDNTQQLVNYSEFGRCLDATDQNPNATWMIDYPCKQAPNPANVAWNQRYTYSSTAKTLSTATGGTTYCLTAPATLSGTPINNVVVLKPCVAGSTLQQWSETGNSGSYATSYTVVSAAGSCLTVVQPGLGDTYHQQWGAAIAGICDGSLVQKWNAPANFIDSRLKGTAEDKGGQ
ncbi:MAG TPA: ricin-type beta-trefoil lectin domain protein [Frankiaceae bacterium]|jgi:Tfp pilus assembly protein PilX|nr:ricin-type beta-trefoil lectin domain protein [Frankiaceae bacterium]